MWWFRTVKDRPSANLPMNCGRLVVQAPCAQEAQGKIDTIIAFWDNGHCLGQVLRGPFGSELLAHLADPQTPTRFMVAPVTG